MGLGYLRCSERSIFSIGLWLLERSPGYNGHTYNRVRQVGNTLSPSTVYGDWSQTVGNLGERHGELRNGPNGAGTGARPSLSDRGFYRSRQSDTPALAR